MYAQRILVPTRGRSRFASMRGGSRKPPRPSVVEKDVAKTQSGRGAQARPDLDVVTSDQEQ